MVTTLYGNSEPIANYPKLSYQKNLETKKAFHHSKFFMNNLKYLWIGLNQIGPQKLARTPEPTAIMNEEQSVNDFDQLIHTQTQCLYTYLLSLCDRIQTTNQKKRALDIACGTGNLSVQLNQILQYDKVFGIDLSEKMLHRAKEKTQNFQNHFQFFNMNATQLAFEDGYFDLSVFFQSAHHINSLQEINKIIQETERVTNKNGSIVIGDLCRMRTAKNAKRFIKTACSHYLEMGLKSLYEDSVNSINAAWSQEELISAIPTNTKRKWFTFKLWPVSAYCFLVSPGESNKDPFMQKKQPSIEQNIPKNLIREYKQMHFSAKMGEIFRNKILR